MLEYFLQTVPPKRITDSFDSWYVLPNFFPKELNSLMITSNKQSACFATTTYIKFWVFLKPIGKI